MSIKYIIFDVMGVIFEDADDTRDLLVPYVRKRNDVMMQQSIVDLYIQTSLGHIRSRDFWRECGLGAEYPDVERDYLGSCLRLDPDFVGVAEQLSQEYSLALLSNDVAEWDRYLREKYSLNRLLDFTVISGDVGYRKPDPNIYRAMLQEAGCPAADCLFIDDMDRNLEAASRLGIVTCKFERGSLIQDFMPDYRTSGFKELPALLSQL
ncbi:HAD family hydrolase [Chloroflexota bacterium]